MDEWMMNSVIGYFLFHGTMSSANECLVLFCSRVDSRFLLHGIALRSLWPTSTTETSSRTSPPPPPPIPPPPPPSLCFSTAYDTVLCAECVCWARYECCWLLKWTTFRSLLGGEEEGEGAVSIVNVALWLAAPIGRAVEWRQFGHVVPCLLLSNDVISLCLFQGLDQSDTCHVMIKRSYYSSFESTEIGNNCAQTNVSPRQLNGYWIYWKRGHHAGA